MLTAPAGKGEVSRALHTIVLHTE